MSSLNLEDYVEDLGYRLKIFEKLLLEGRHLKSFVNHFVDKVHQLTVELSGQDPKFPSLVCQQAEEQLLRSTGSLDYKFSLTKRTIHPLPRDTANDSIWERYGRRRSEQLYQEWRKYLSVIKKTGFESADSWLREELLDLKDRFFDLFNIIESRYKQYGLG